MLGTHIIVIERTGFLDGVFNHLLGTGGLGQLAHGHHIRAALDQLFDFQTQFLDIDIQIL